MGLLNAVVFESRMPDDIVGWLVKYHNDFGRDGSPYSFQELMKEIPEMGMRKHTVARLDKCMYGTRDAGAIWEGVYVSALTSMGFVQGSASPCCFHHQKLLRLM